MDRTNQIKIGKLGIILVHLLSFSCSVREPNRDDIIGRWEGAGAARIAFAPNGTFGANAIPTKLLLFTDTSSATTTGVGKWSLEKNQGLWVVTLEFNQVNTVGHSNGYETQLNISGTGILENRPPFYIFLWHGEEGEDRFKFMKTK